MWHFFVIIYLANTTVFMSCFFGCVHPPHLKGRSLKIRDTGLWSQEGLAAAVNHLSNAGGEVMRTFPVSATVSVATDLCPDLYERHRWPRLSPRTIVPHYFSDGTSAPGNRSKVGRRRPKPRVRLAAVVFRRPLGTEPLAL